MTPEETIQRVREAMAALSQGDIGAAGALLHPDYSYTIRGQASVSGVYRGWEAMAGVLRRILDMTNGTLTATPEIVLADDENVLMYMHVKASRPDGRTYDNHQAYRYRIKDGLVIEGETHPGRPGSIQGVLRMNEYRRDEIGGLALMARMEVRAGRGKDLLQFLEEAVEVSAQHEPDGALTAIFHSSLSDPETVIEYSHWPGRSSFDEHRANFDRVPAYGEMRERLAGLLAKPVELVALTRPIVRYRRTDPAGSEILAGGDGAYRKEDTGGVAFLARFLAREGKRDELLPLFDEAAAMQAEHEPDGALTVVLHTSPTNLDEVLVYEHYPSQAALDGHRAMLASYGPYQDLRRRLGELLTQPPEIVEVAVPVVRFVRVGSQEKEASA